jgi:hypothetical protein
MMTNLPRAAAIPPISALPYPRNGTGTTRAPARVAMPCEPSVEPLSATMTSPSMLADSNAASAFRMQVSSVSASFRQGMTTDTSTAPVCGARASSTGKGAAEMGSTWVKGIPP